MLSKSLFTLVLSSALMTMGCTSLPLQSEPTPLQASLREPCADLSPPTGGSRAQILKWSVETARLYRECQSRHRRTVEAWPKSSTTTERQSP